MGYELTDEFRKELEEKFYSQLEYFYENYGPKENYSQQQDQNEDTNTIGKKIVGKKRKSPKGCSSSSETSHDKDVENEDKEDKEDKEDNDENENEDIEVKQKKQKQSPKLTKRER